MNESEQYVKQEGVVGWVSLYNKSKTLSLANPNCGFNFAKIGVQNNVWNVLKIPFKTSLVHCHGVSIFNNCCIY